MIEQLPESHFTFQRFSICLTLRAPYALVERVPGTSNIGIQIPNQRRETIYLRQLIESSVFRESASKLTVAMGLTTDGAYYVTDLHRLPHLLIAGSTGSGKSVFINTLIISLMYKARPDEVKLILVDPKRVELGLYSDIPHLATPVITDPKRASIALKWAVAEMERRFREMAAWGVRDIEDLNTEIHRRNSAQDFDANGEPWKPLPYIIIIVDELADLMMACPAEVEESLTTLARKERAVGVHLVLATQRPSAEVITGPIKANFPARLSFHVASTSVLQRRLRIGYGRAVAILDQLEREGLIGQADGARPRPVLRRAFELVDQWDEKEGGIISSREDKPALNSNSIDAKPT